VSDWLVDEPVAQPSGGGTAVAAPPRPVPKHVAAAIAAYCAEFCGSEQAQQATEEALARVRDLGSFDDDQVLHVVREAAAQHVPMHSSQSRLTRALSAEHVDDCAATPRLLVARANGELSVEQAAKLSAHLDDCMRCQAQELRMEQAERAFATALAGGPAADGVLADPAAGAESSAHPWLPDETAETYALPATAALATSEAAAAAGGRWGDRRPLRRTGVVGGAAALVFAAAVALAIGLTHGSKSSSTTTAPARAVVTTSIPKAKPAHHKPAHHARVVHHAKKHKPAPRPKPAPTTVASAPSTVTPVVQAPAASTPTPTPTPTPAPVPTPQPAPSNPSSVSIGGSGGLPSASAPTRGIGSGKH
jgi:hypothetical protein